MSGFRICCLRLFLFFAKLIKFRITLIAFTGFNMGIHGCHTVCLAVCHSLFPRRSRRFLLTSCIRIHCVR